MTVIKPIKFWVWNISFCDVWCVCVLPVPVYVANQQAGSGLWVQVPYRMMFFFFNITICYWISIDIDFKLLTDCIFLPNHMQYLLLPNSYVNIHERLLLDVQQNPFSSKHLRGTELTLVVNTSSRSLPIHNISCLWRIVMSLPKNDPESIELIVNNQWLSNCEKKICLSMLYCLLIVFWHAFIYLIY